ncbi:hypothetical protein E1301_Tti018051 [Triplophysa tibetana]|uniref:Uncharacterized protein n=1 Tax=Triplophysa tibetana TaxID=1572043 RepID=A0A5A9NIW9_9TELE|nr:hypothetical protein E1301_Tti018051 [Triplophysa tibetana]
MPLKKESKGGREMDGERIPLSKEQELKLVSISGDNSEVEDLSDIDDPVEDVDYPPPQQEPISREEESSGVEDPIPQSSLGRKCLCDEGSGYRSDRTDDRDRCGRPHAQPELYQGADALTAQVQELGLEGLVIYRLSKLFTLVQKCDRFFTSIKAVNRMMEKKVDLTGTGMKNRVPKQCRGCQVTKK